MVGWGRVGRCWKQRSHTQAAVSSPYGGSPNAAISLPCGGFNPHAAVFTPKRRFHHQAAVSLACGGFIPRQRFRSQTAVSSQAAVSLHAAVSIPMRRCQSQCGGFTPGS
eukprot:2971559-Prymnesium_polylepis.1